MMVSSPRVDPRAEVPIGGAHGPRPGRSVHVRVQGRIAVGVAIEHVELVGKLVDHHVDPVQIAGARHVGPGQDHRAAQPGLAGVGLVALVHDADLVDVLVPRARTAPGRR